MFDWQSFLGDNYFLAVYGVTWFISVAHYRKYFDTGLKYFPMLIAYTFFNELLGYFIRYSEDFAFFNNRQFANDIIYNVYDVVFFSFFYFLYWKLIQRADFKNTVKYLGITVLMAFIISCFFQNPLIMALFYATSYASVVLVICIILYQSGKEKTVPSQEKYNLMNWVSLGLIIFYSIFPVIFLIGFLKHDIWVEYELGLVHKVLIIIMYVIFSMGFIVSRRRAFR